MEQLPRITFYTGGSIYKLDTAGTLTTLHEFTAWEQSNPQSPLLLDSVGNLYGTTSAGGTHGLGTVFRLEPSGTLTTLHSFKESDGQAPNGGLVRDNWGNLYGTTSASRSFRLNAAGTLTTLHVFDHAIRVADGVPAGRFDPGRLRKPLRDDHDWRYRRNGASSSGSPSPRCPTITSFTPTAGRVSTRVTINGTGFTGVSSVKFNGKAAAFNVLSSTQLTANVPAGTTSGKITVTTPAGTATSAADFIVVSTPTVTGFTPGSGVPGTTVVITGTNFDTASAVAFDTASTTVFTINSPTQITVTVPSAAKTGKIKVTNPAGAGWSVTNFLVPPTITSFSPTSGRAGTKVIINGTTFLNATSVTINGVAATFTVNSSIKITATVPSGATSGKIAVTTPGGTATSATNFKVLPTITSFSPTSGRAGTHVIINGNTFLNTKSVTFNGVAANFTINSSTKITAGVPSGATSGRIAVTTPSGTATSATNFTVLP